MRYVKEIRNTFKTCLLNATVEAVVRVHDLMTYTHDIGIGINGGNAKDWS